MKLKIFVLSLLLIGCASPVTLYTKPYPPVSEDTVQVYRNKRPNCQYIEIGQISMGRFTANIAIKDARKLAAQNGADGILIERLNFNGDLLATMYKCTGGTNKAIPMYYL